MARDRLIPFHEHPRVFACADSPAALAEILRKKPERFSDPAVRTETERLVNTYLGLNDGHASERVLTRLRAIVAAAIVPTQTQMEYRRMVERRGRRYVRGALVRAGAQTIGWIAVHRVSSLARILFSARFSGRWTDDRADWSRRRWAECWRAVSGLGAAPAELMGEPPIPLSKEVALALLEKARRRSDARQPEAS
jgi:hypothetical protein